MNSSQKRILWAVAVALSAVLFWVGVGRPIQERGNFRGFSPKIQLTLAERIATQEQQERSAAEYRERTTPNYLIGIGGPVILLGAAAFLTTRGSS